MVGHWWDAERKGSWVSAPPPFWVIEPGCVDVLTDRGLKCPVCLLEFEEQETVRQMPCKHFFHSGCILPWLGKVSYSSSSPSHHTLIIIIIILMTWMNLSSYPHIMITVTPWPYHPQDLNALTTSSLRPHDLQNLIKTSTMSPWPHHLPQNINDLILMTFRSSSWPLQCPPWHHPPDLHDLLMTSKTSSWPHNLHNHRLTSMTSSPRLLCACAMTNFHVLESGVSDPRPTRVRCVAWSCPQTTPSTKSSRRIR